MGAWFPSPSLSTWMPIVSHRHFIQHLFSLHWKNGRLGSFSVALYLDAYRCSSTFICRLVTLHWKNGRLGSLCCSLLGCLVRRHSSVVSCSLHCKKGVRQNPDTDLAARKPDIVLLLKFGRRCVTPLAVIFSQTNLGGFFVFF